MSEEVSETPNPGDGEDKGKGQTIQLVIKSKMVFHGIISHHATSDQTRVISLCPYTKANCNQMLGAEHGEEGYVL